MMSRRIILIPQYNYHNFEIYTYKKQLKKDSNIVGAISIIFYLIMSGVSVIAMLFPALLGVINGESIDSALGFPFLEDTAFLMLLSGLASIVTFFGVTIIYCLITKANLGKMFPLDKIGCNVTYHLCAVGLGICMIANYVSNLILALFDMIGIDAMIDMEYECDSVLDVILFYLTIAVLPALVEEFAFRGVILGVLRKYSDGLAVLVSGILFGLMHGNFAQIPFATVVGLILGYIAVKTNSLLPGIIIHFLNNGISVTLTLLISNTELSDLTVGFINMILMTIIAILGIISFTVLSTKHKGFFKLFDADKTLSFKEKLITVCKSPTVIIFIILMIIEAVAMLALPGV